jgi:hypothetical protein
VTSGFTTWEQLGPVHDDVLLIVNSQRDNDVEVAAAYRELDQLAGDRLSVIADPSWRQWMTDHGVGGERALYTCDAQGEAIELNHFLESSVAIRWVMAKQLRFIAGSAPHSLYNEEVKAIFEQRVGLLLREGILVAHALPDRGVYLFDLAALLHRFGREAKRQAYQAACRRMVDELYQVWRQRGAPDVADGADHSEVVRRIFSHLDPAVVDCDGRHANPTPLDDDITGPAANFVSHLQEVIHGRERELTAFVGNLHAVIHDREQALAERAEAVVIRDKIIEDLRLELETPFRRLRRWLRRSDRP